MSETRTRVIDDLAVESDLLDDLVAGLDEAAWATPTPAAGWTIAHQIAHLAWTDEAAVVAMTEPDRFQQLIQEFASKANTIVDEAASEGAQAAPADVLDRWRNSRATLEGLLRRFPEGQKVAWFGPPMSATSMATARIMETWAHGLDVVEALGLQRDPSDRIRHVAHLGVRARDFAYMMNGLPAPEVQFRVELTSPSGELWTWGTTDAPQQVTGAAYDFCLLVTRRRHRADLDLKATGPDADKWLDIAQAFAGPPGTGRDPQGNPGTAR